MSTLTNVSIQRDSKPILYWLTEWDCNTVAMLFIALFDAIVKDPDAVAHGREGYYFAENGEHAWYDISKEIARVLLERGISGDEEPTTFTPEELVKYWGSEECVFLSHSSRCWN